MKEITNEQAAYIAGFLEGEGSFILAHKIRRGRNYYGQSIKTSQASYGSKILETLIEITGIGHLDFRKKTRHPKARYSSLCWVISRRDEILPLVRRVYPYLLSSRTKKRAKYIYQMARLKRINGWSRAGRSEQTILSSEKIYSLWEKTRHKEKVR